jgi:hypothetical protein
MNICKLQVEKVLKHCTPIANFIKLFSANFMLLLAFTFCFNSGYSTWGINYAENSFYDINIWYQSHKTFLSKSTNSLLQARSFRSNATNILDVYKMV